MTLIAGRLVYIDISIATGKADCRLDLLNVLGYCSR
jgi:hypothetical protein